MNSSKSADGYPHRPLPHASPQPPESPNDGFVNADVPIPWRKLFPLFCFCVSEAMTYAVVFPFITDMVTSLGVPQDKIGLYAGLGEGVMMFVEALSAHLWAVLADKYGRRPCLILGGVIGVIVSPLVGFSSTMWQVILWRACLGLNPTGVLAKVTIAELSHPSNRSQIFTFLGPAFSIGLIFGTFIGGQFAHPFGRLPFLLGGTNQFWLRHPYALPGCVTGLLNAGIVLIGVVFLTETRPAPSTSQKARPNSKNRYLAASSVSGFATLVAIFFAFQVVNRSWDGMFAVYTYTQPGQGGLGLAVDTIGLLYSAYYLISSAMSPIFLPRMEKRWGAVRALLLVLATWPLVAVLIPVTQWSAVHARWAMWGVMLLQLSFRAVGGFGIALCNILMMRSFDGYPMLMATGSAISTISAAVGKAFGPAMAGWIFSISTQYPTGSLLRQMSWIYMLAVSIPAILLARTLRNRSLKTVEDGTEGEREGLLEAARGSDGTP